ncbi:hypothetical protein Glove_481g70 [Diversispora epigaea]|uniref:Uncharacterized protein n=1 Tax=Diversispora epigaea TaxID=1348612 RepID=A0A397GP75_9GLOM|nr:hypothetical protein Glove_481g70 [Diversispora epigaea]
MSIEGFETYDFGRNRFNFSQKKKKHDICLLTDEDTTDDEASDIEIEFIDNQIEIEATELFSVLKKNMETLKLSKRPLRNLGNSRTTKYWKKVKALESQKKKGQTLDQLLFKRETQKLDNENLNNKKYLYQINQIENRLNNERNLHQELNINVLVHPKYTDL